MSIYSMNNNFYISWLGAPYFEPEDREECGFRMKRNLILEVPHEMYNDELFCTLVDNDVLLPLKEDDMVEAELSFQAYEENGIGHQEIFVHSIKKQERKEAKEHLVPEHFPWDDCFRAPW